MAGLSEKLIGDFDRAMVVLGESFPDKIQALRKEALDTFSNLGIPTTRNEYWKYTNVKSALNYGFTMDWNATSADSSRISLDSFRYGDLDAYHVFVVDGHVVPGTNGSALPEGVTVSTIREAAGNSAAFDKHFGHITDFTNRAFVALNTAYFRDGVFVHVAKGARPERPVHIVHVTSARVGLMTHTRNLLVFEEESEGSVVESFRSAGDAKTFSTSVTEVFVGASANANHYVIEAEDDEAGRVNTLQVYQEGNSTFSNGTVTLGGAFVRNNINVLPDGEHCETNLNGLYVPTGDEFVDNHSFVDHARPNCNSNELYKGILNGSSTAVFNGKLFVRQHAQVTNAFQSNKNILLSDDASVNTKPELEIYADDVKCSHGATTGFLDKDALFYFQARGIPYAQARKLLLQAFLTDILDSIEIEPVRAFVEQNLSLRLE